MGAVVSGAESLAIVRLPHWHRYNHEDSPEYSPGRTGRSSRHALQGSPVQLLASGAAELGLLLTRAQLAQFERYRKLMLAANQRVNLTSITDPAAVESRHFL